MTVNKPEILRVLQETYPEAKAELHFSNPYEMLVSTMLSAQCTDKQVNKVTPAVFRDFPNPRAMAATTAEVLYPYIKSCGFKTKAANIVAACQIITEKYNGEVPADMDALTSLPGVGRKTANVIQAVAFGKAALAVDTHVFRVSHRLGLVPKRCTTPYSVEMELRRFIPEAQVASSHYWLLLHGRYTCLARKPKCHLCGLRSVCRSAPKEESTAEQK